MQPCRQTTNQKRWFPVFCSIYGVKSNAWALHFLNVLVDEILLAIYFFFNFMENAMH